MDFSSFISYFKELLNSGLAYPILFIFSLGEALPFIGTFIPGQTMTITAAFLAQQGILNFYYVIILAALGSIIGDTISYLMAKKIKGAHIKFIHRKNKKHKHAIFEKVSSSIKRNPGKTIIFGRHNPLTRAITPFVAGISGVEASKFYPYVIIAGLTWGILWSFVGFLFGEGNELIAKYIGTYSILIILILIIVSSIYHHYHHSTRIEF